ncbi:PREDICTED: uncharacterized protein LOC105566980 [Vollenhovia emeryi]|uniref:uncharacterized protein LOC105566980 n=1 Tax=Vollenhovia emeryi TaxID=411798 RepID=UPI0005F39511|nr:PREDICTED: uncharacterized protein LOC105566980 [Vollenhovia emeryi]
MKVVKYSVSRKCFHRLSARQRRRIALEIKDTLHFNVAQDSVTPEQPDNAASSIHGDDSSQTDKVSFTDDVANYISNVTYTDNLDNDILSISNDNDSEYSTSSFLSTSNDETFQDRLAACFVNNNITHVQCNNILSVLRTHTCFSSLPKDVRTLLKTPRTPVVVSKVDPGKYIHFSLEAEIIKTLSCLPSVSVPRKLEIDFNTDGCSLDRVGSNHIWPIQCRLANIKYTRPIIIGIYSGAEKPHNPNLFFEKFVADVNNVISNGGIDFAGNKIPIRLRCFIADAPARAFVLNHKGHTSGNPCSKCKVSGLRYEDRYTFGGVNHPLRTNEEYLRCIDEDHHKDGKSPLSMLPIGMVSQVPFEYMHLVCLGVMKKLLSAWICGKYTRFSKLPARSIAIISQRLDNLKTYCPSDFARRPRAINEFSKYKATEFRQFLLYTGPVVTYGLLNHQVYTHFLFLHTAIRILISNSPSKVYLNFAELALQKFVARCENLYGLSFISYNVHGLLHLTNDVRQLGPLDSFSAFPYENNMPVFRKYCRKPNFPLQQFYNRMSEMETCGTNLHRGETYFSKLTNSSTQVFSAHNKGPLPPNINPNSYQYRKLIFNKILLSLDIRDNCCILHDGSICLIINILVDNATYYLVVKKFQKVDSFYDVGILSSTIQIFKCSAISNEIFCIEVNQVRFKCYKMPYWSDSSIGDSSDIERKTESPE